MFPPFLYDYDPTIIQLVGGTAQLILPNTLGILTIQELFTMNTFTSLTETVTKTGADDVTYQMKVDGVLKYWNGSAWAASDGSYAQSNSVSVVNAHAATLVSSPPKTVQVVVVLKGSGTTSPSLDNLVVLYDNTPIFTPAAGKCTVYCYLQDILGDDLTAAGNAPQLVASNDVSFVNEGFFVPSFFKTADFAADMVGLIASLSLSRTEDVNQKIRFAITYEPNGSPGRVKTIHLKPCVIPNQSQVDLSTITSIDSAQLI